MTERRDTERILLAIPIRVTAYGEGEKGFSEETHTIEINRGGARIALKHRVAPDETIRIVNLENLREADFRIAGPCRVESGETGDWGVECLEPERDLWEIKFSAPLETKQEQAGALLECEECGTQTFSVLRSFEVDALASGSLQRLCQKCGGPTAWNHADVSHRRKTPTVPEPAVEAVAGPEAGQPEVKPAVGVREHKGLALKLPILVRNEKGEEEVTKTEIVSKGGVTVCLGIKLEVGDILTVYCPYSEGGLNFEQKAEVRNCSIFFEGERWLYELQYV
jgi:hypothetical protein